MPMSDFLVKRNDLRECRIVESGVPELEPGQALLRVDSFGLTANNVTYAVLGEMMSYWELLSSRERLGSCPDVGLRRGGAKRGKRCRAGHARLRIPSPLVLCCRDPRPSRRERLRRRLAASSVAAFGVSALPGDRHGSFLPCGHRGSADALASVVLHIVSDRGPARRRRARRARADRDLKRLEQDRNRRRLPSGAARGGRADWADLRAQRRVRRRASASTPAP